ncbi:carboxylate--amine ligase [Kaarinaea lacus]
MKPAIVLSGHTMALGVVRALGEKGVPVVMVHYDERDMGHVSKYVTQQIQSPHPEKNQAEFINLLIECSDQFNGSVLFPVSDETVVAVAQNKDQLEEYYRVACPSWQIAQQFIEKKYTYALADANGIPAPKTIIPASVADVEKYATDVDFPCLVKPSQSHLFYDYFKRKMFPVSSADELLSVYRQAAEAGLEVMLQEIIPGDDINVVNYNAYFSESEPLLEFTAQHIRNAPPWWGSPRVVLSKNIPEVIDPGRNILKAMNYSGYACTEFKKDERDNIYKLMEVNGRHNLSTLLAVRCGINFPWLQYQHLLFGEKLSARQYTTGIYWVDIPRDVGYSIKYFRREKYSLKQYLLPYVKPHVFAILDSHDIKPFIKRITYLAKQALRMVTDFLTFNIYKKGY